VDFAAMGLSKGVRFQVSGVRITENIPKDSPSLAHAEGILDVLQPVLPLR